MPSSNRLSRRPFRSSRRVDHPAANDNHGDLQRRKRRASVCYLLLVLVFVRRRRVSYRSPSCFAISGTMVVRRDGDCRLLVGDYRLLLVEQSQVPVWRAGWKIAFAVSPSSAVRRGASDAIVVGPALDQARATSHRIVHPHRPSVVHQVLVLTPRRRLPSPPRRLRRRLGTQRHAMTTSSY